MLKQTANKSLFSEIIFSETLRADSDKVFPFFWKSSMEKSRREKFKVSLKNEVLFKAETMHAAPKGTACGDVSTRAATQRTVFIPIYQLFFWKWLNVIPKLARPWVTERRFVEKPNIFAIGACA